MKQQSHKAESRKDLCFDSETCLQRQQSQNCPCPQSGGEARMTCAMEGGGVFLSIPPWPRGILSLCVQEQRKGGKDLQLHRVYEFMSNRVKSRVPKNSYRK